jgi:hypothetical protein
MKKIPTFNPTLLSLAFKLLSEMQITEFCKDCTSLSKQLRKQNLRFTQRFEVNDGVFNTLKTTAVPLHTTKALGLRGGIAPTHSRPRH